MVDERMMMQAELQKSGECPLTVKDGSFCDEMQVMKRLQSTDDTSGAVVKGK